MDNGERVIYLQQLKVEKAKRTGILLTLVQQKLESLAPVAMLPERHPTPYVECKDCKEYGRDLECHCGGSGVEVDSTYHCGVEGCYQCEIWPLE